MTAFSDVLRYVAEDATEDEVSALFDAANARTRVLRTLRAGDIMSRLVPGESRVRVIGIRPKYLAGVTGTFTRFENVRGKQCAVITPDPMYLATVRRSSYRDELSGIPASCLELIA